ncbi:Uncharacterized protein HZ326_4718 [Fusarium oxysporum f. sp. albedinis]|nr:Uncharacterized protein HZ326_4718 [Fusarium oxysporum f. sp. albedinis]
MCGASTDIKEVWISRTLSQFDKSWCYHATGGFVIEGWIRWQCHHRTFIFNHCLPGSHRLHFNPTSYVLRLINQKQFRPSSGFQ